MDTTTRLSIAQRYHFIRVKKNAFSIQDCLDLANEVECALNAGQKYIIIEFSPDSVLSGSLPGFIIDKIKKAKQLNGEIIIVAPTETQRAIFTYSQLTLLTPVVNSVESVHA